MSQFDKYFSSIFKALLILGTDKELSGMIPVMSCKNMMIESRVVISSAIFSPLSGGSVNPRTHMNEMSTQGKMRLKRK